MSGSDDADKPPGLFSLLVGNILAPVFGALIAVAGFPGAYLAAALLAAAAIPLVPARSTVAVIVAPSTGASIA